jgi:ElaB/YqjD/DUF883 family membrane-anchored ribosome-binding protein
MGGTSIPAARWFDGISVQKADRASHVEHRWQGRMRNLADKLAAKDSQNYQCLEKDVAAVKEDIATLTDQITDALNTFAGSAQKQARRGYKQARDNVDSMMSDAQDRGSAALDAAHDAALSIEESLEDVIAQRPLATVGLALGVGFLLGAMWRR